MKISVCIPTYKGVPYLKETLDSVVKQTYKNFELIICNDSHEDTEDLKNLLDSYSEFEIHFYQNNQNLGYPINLRKCVEKSSGEILFLMGQDDILLQDNIFEKSISIFRENSNIGAITRPYYWFDESLDKPIRSVPPSSKRVINVQDEKKYLEAVYETVGQLSALVYRKELITEPFNENVFTAHIYPFLSVMKTHDVYFWEDYNLAVRTSSSQTRFLSSIYNPSPTKTWVEMFQKVFSEKEFDHAREVGIEHITTNYIGLVQIKNYGYFKDLLRDVYYLVKYRPANLLNLKFWSVLLGVLFIPRIILRKMVDFYKNKISKSQLEDLLNGN